MTFSSIGSSVDGETTDRLVYTGFAQISLHPSSFSPHVRLRLSIYSNHAIGRWTHDRRKELWDGRCVPGGLSQQARQRRRSDQERWR